MKMIAKRLMIALVFAALYAGHAFGTPERCSRLPLEQQAQCIRDSVEEIDEDSPTADVPVCENGAIDYPECDDCGPGRRWTFGGICEDGCDNDAVNPPECTECGEGLTLEFEQCRCANGAENVPECDQCEFRRAPDFIKEHCELSCESPHPMGGDGPTYTPPGGDQPDDPTNYRACIAGSSSVDLHGFIEPDSHQGKVAICYSVTGVQLLGHEIWRRTGYQCDFLPGCAAVCRDADSPEYGEDHEVIDSILAGESCIAGAPDQPLPDIPLPPFVANDPLGSPSRDCDGWLKEFEKTLRSELCAGNPVGWDFRHAPPKKSYHSARISGVHQTKGELCITVDMHWLNADGSMRRDTFCGAQICERHRSISYFD